MKAIKEIIVDSNCNGCYFAKFGSIDSGECCRIDPRYPSIKINVDVLPHNCPLRRFDCIIKLGDNK